MKKIKIALAVFFLAAIMMPFLRTSVSAAGSILFDKTNITVYENPSHSSHEIDYQLDFNPEPTENVTINYSTNAECEVRQESGGFTVGGALISKAEFHEFSVRAIDDSKDDGNHTCYVTYEMTSADSNYNGYTKVQPIKVVDNNDTDTDYSFSIVPLSSNSLVEGSTETHKYGVQVSVPPKDPITLYATGGEQCRILQDGQPSDIASQRIAAGSNKLATFTAISVEDAVFEGSHECTITHSMSTNDTSFSGVLVPSYSVTVADNDKTYLQEQADAQKQADIEAEAAKDNGTLDYFDANNDGIIDIEQDNVLNFINPISNLRHALVLDGPANCSFVGSVNVISENELTKPQPSLHFPNGLYGYSVECEKQAQDVTVTLLLDDKFSDDYGWLLRKITPDKKLVTLTDAEFGVQKLQNGEVTTITFSVREGGPFDEDGVTNGVLVDPFGLALAADMDTDVALLARLDDTPFSSSQTLLALSLGAVMVLSVALIASQSRVHNWLINHKPKHPHTVHIDHF